jgi:hypothetical protein
MALQRVLLRFPTDIEVRYVERLPVRGERIQGRGGEDFVVSRVLFDEVVCVQPDEYRDEQADPRV